MGTIEKKLLKFEVMTTKKSEEKLFFIWKKILLGKSVQRTVDLSQVNFLQQR